MGVHRSGYYAYRERSESPRARENEKLQSLIHLIWSKSRELYGSPRITAELRSQGLRCGKNRVARLMREAGIRSQTKKAFKVTTKSEGLTEAADLVQRRFQADTYKKYSGKSAKCALQSRIEGSEFRFLRRTTFPPAELGIEIGHRVKKRIFMPVGGPGQDKKVK